MNVNASQALKEMKNKTDSGTLFQGVSCHPVFMGRQGVTHAEFDEFVDILGEHDDTFPYDAVVDLRGVYSRLLDSGFFDAYLGIHFDVNNVATYVTVVSGWKWSFDTETGKLKGVYARNKAANARIQRLSRVVFLRGFGHKQDFEWEEGSCRNVHLPQEVGRYFCFSSIIDEIMKHMVRKVTL